MCGQFLTQWGVRRKYNKVKIIKREDTVKEGVLRGVGERPGEGRRSKFTQFNWRPAERKAAQCVVLLYAALIASSENQEQGTKLLIGGKLSVRLVHWFPTNHIPPLGSLEKYMASSTF